MARVLADIDLVLSDVLEGMTNVPLHGTNLPADFGSTKAPWVTAKAIPGGGGPTHPRFANAARVLVDVWGFDRREVSDLAEDVRAEIADAHRAQTVYPHGRVSFQECTSTPAEVAAPAPLPQLTIRFQALYRLVVRA